MKLKKILVSILALALVVTSLYPIQLVNAAETTVQNDGLNFDTVQKADNNYYYTDEKLTQFPSTFEATVRMQKGETISRPGTILGNAIINETNTSTDQTGNFNFGLINGVMPYIWVADATNTHGTVYKFGDDEASNYAKFVTSEWIHITIVNDQAANKVLCYVNGELWKSLDGAYKGTWTMSDNKLRLGGDNRTGNTQNFKGDIKNVAIYSDARTATEVASDYKNGVKGTESSLMAAYNLGLTAEGSYPAFLDDLSFHNFDLKKDWIKESEVLKLSGRKDYDYSMAIVGDPQIVTAHAQNVASGGSTLSGRRNADDDDKIFQWIVDNKESKNIQFAFNLGDLNDNNTQWESALPALQLLDNKVPYSIVRGNHDHVTEFIANIKYDDYKDRIEGSFDGTTMLNTYQKFEVEGHKYMVINLDFGVGGEDANDADAVLAWANGLVESNPDYQVIVTTHAYQASDGSRLTDGVDGYATAQKNGYYREKNGDDIWNEFVSLHENIIMVLSGHVGSKTIVKTESIGVYGNKVVELMVNPQQMDKQLIDSGYLYGGMVAMLYFSNDGKDVSVEWYSTIRDQFYTVESQFSFDTTTVTGENGDVAIQADMVDMTGSVPVSKIDKYKDYIFAGWFADSSCKSNVAISSSSVSDTSYAKFIPAEILGVKAQVSTAKLTSGENAGNWVMRFVSSVDDLNYRNVGFKVTYEEGGQTKTKSSVSDTVYEKIKSVEEETEYGFSTGVISGKSEYFITGKMAIADTVAAKATEYTVQAYVETLSGEISYGPARILTFNDANGTSLNVDVQASKQLSTSTTYTATYGLTGTEKTATKVEVLSSNADGYSNIRITIDGGVDALASATRFVISDANGVVATDIYRNYYTTHVSGNVAKPNADTSWYYINPAAEEFVLGSSADLYGFSSLVTDNKLTFEGKTLILIRDVKVNEGQAVRATGSTAAGWNEPDGVIYPWRPIGRNANYLFQGTFDGQENVVSGLYLKNKSGNTFYDGSGYAGFFGIVGEMGVIKNLAVTNSYFENAVNYTGAIAGFCRSRNVSNLYSDAVLAAYGSHNAGGIFGRYGDAADSYDKAQLRAISGCWFNGQINITGGMTWIGGLIGQTFRANNFRISDCLFSGEINLNGTSTSPTVGGIYAGNNTNVNIVMENCVMTGTINSNGTATSGVGSIVGTVNGTAISAFNNCYATSGGPLNKAFATVTGTEFTPASADYIVNVDSLKVTTEQALLAKLPLLEGQTESAWVCTKNGTPVLKTFVE